MKQVERVGQYTIFAITSAITGRDYSYADVAPAILDLTDGYGCLAKSKLRAMRIDGAGPLGEF